MRKRDLTKLKFILFQKKQWRQELERRRRKNKIRKNRKNKKGNGIEKLSSRINKNKIEKIVANRIFSIINDPSNTLAVFNSLSSEIHKKNPVYLDASEIEEISIDALLYLLALLNRMKVYNIPFHLRGNLPRNSDAKQKFIESGFLRYTTESKTISIETGGDCLQIFDGNNATPDVARKLCVFTMEKLNVDRNYTKGLYDIVMEVILNTKQHAYNSPNQLSKWYSYAWFDKNNDEILFTILDTGSGIPTTVRKNWKERISEIISKVGLVESKDSSILNSVLNGDFRTKTGEKYRGKGIPKIQSYNDSKYISNLTIVSNLGYTCKETNKMTELPVKFNGTLFSWRMKHGN